VTAAVALIIFLAAPYAAGLANIWTFVLLGIGLILIGVEIFLSPGHGVTGLIGAALVLIAIIGTFLPAEPSPGKAPFFHWPQLQGTWEYLQTGIIYLSSSVIVAFIGILLILRFLPQLRVVRRLIPANPEGAVLPISDPFRGAAQVGELGIVTGDLRPGGQARFGQEVVDVQSQGEYVEAGRRVQVIRREGIQIVVRPLPDDSAT
jgi:membrane-bound serine protease (ClpP class)